MSDEVDLGLTMWVQEAQRVEDEKQEVTKTTVIMWQRMINVYSQGRNPSSSLPLA